MPEKKASGWFWPKIKDEESAKKASRQGIWAAGFFAVGTSAVSIIGHFSQPVLGMFDIYTLLDAVFFAVIAWGIYKLSRAAAVLGLALYLVERIDMWLRLKMGISILAVLLILMFINSVRGTFAYHKLIGKGADAEALSSEGEAG